MLPKQAYVHTWRSLTSQWHTTGDHLAVIPENDPEEVRRVIAALHVSGSEVVQLMKHAGEDGTPSNRAKAALSQGTTLQYAMTALLDLHGPAPRALLRLMAAAASDYGLCDERQKLEHMTTTEQVIKKTALSQFPYCLLFIVSGDNSFRVALYCRCAPPLSRCRLCDSVAACCGRTATAAASLLLDLIQ